MSRQSGGFFSDMIRQLIALGAVAGLCWFGYDQGWVEEFVNKPPKSAEQSDNSGANASPAWDKSYGEPDKKSPSRPYVKYTAHAMKKKKKSSRGISVNSRMNLDTPETNSSSTMGTPGIRCHAKSLLTLGGRISPIRSVLFVKRC